MPLVAEGRGSWEGIRKKRLSFLNRFWWEQRESNPRPSACKADALNQLSYAPFSFLFGGYFVISPKINFKELCPFLFGIAKVVISVGSANFLTVFFAKKVKKLRFSLICVVVDT